MVNSNDPPTPLFNALIHGKTDGFSTVDQNLWLQKGILYSIRLNPDPDSVSLLLQAVLHNPFPEINVLSARTLYDLAQDGNPDAIHWLFNLAVNHQHSGAIQFLLEHPFLLSKPDDLVLFYLFYKPEEVISQKFWMDSLLATYRQASTSLKARISQSIIEQKLEHLFMILSCLVDQNTDQVEILIKNYPFFTPEEKVIILNYFKNSANISSVFLTDLICRLYILFDDEQLLSLVKTYHWEPSDPINRALFLFLTQNWEAYLNLDFNRSLISTAYEASPDSVRKKLLKLSRQSGITDWLAGLSSRNKDRWLSDLSFMEWAEIINYSGQNGLWPELWQVCQSAPAYWGAQILQKFSQSGWTPPDEQDFFHSSMTLAAELSFPMEIQKNKVLYATGHHITSLVFNESTGWLAAGSKDQEILLWNTQNGYQNLPGLLSPVASTRDLLISSSGEHLAAVNIDNVIRIYQLPEGKIVKTLSGHSNFVKSICLHPDNRTLFSADFDGNIFTWRFPFGNLLNQVRLCDGEIYSLDLSEDGKVLFACGGCGHVHAWDWSVNQTIKQKELSREIYSYLNIHNQNSTCTIYSPSRRLINWNYESDKITSTVNFPATTPVFTSLKHFSILGLLATGSNNGILEIISPENGEILASSTVAGSHTSITGMALSSDELTLFTGTSDGKVYIWDLFPSSIVQIPIKRISPQQLNLIQHKNGASLSPSLKKWMELVHSFSVWHRRFDIQLSQESRLSLGEFDIII